MPESSNFWATGKDGKKVRDTNKIAAVLRIKASRPKREETTLRLTILLNNASYASKVLKMPIVKVDPLTYAEVVARAPPPAMHAKSLIAEFNTWLRQTFEEGIIQPPDIEAAFHARFPVTARYWNSAFIPEPSHS